MDPYFYLFMELLTVFFCFFFCAIIGRNLSKKCKLPLCQTQTGQSNNICHKILFNILLEAALTTIWGQRSKKYRSSQLVGACVVSIYEYDNKKLQSPLNTRRKYILLIYYGFFSKLFFHLSFIFQVYTLFVILFTQSKLMAGLIRTLSIKNILSNAIVSYLL